MDAGGGGGQRHVRLGARGSALWLPDEKGVSKGFLVHARVMGGWNAVLGGGGGGAVGAIAVMLQNGGHVAGHALDPLLGPGALLVPSSVSAGVSFHSKPAPAAVFLFC